MQLSDHLLDADQWPKSVRDSDHFSLLRQTAAFSLTLVEQLSGSLHTDATLHYLFGALSQLANWLPMPKPSKSEAPCYTRATWDLRALAKMIPKGLRLQLEDDGQSDEGGFVRWEASLFDYENSGTVDHPSDLEHNAALNYDGGEYSEAWTPNLALARILLAAYLLAGIQVVRAEVEPMANQPRIGTKPPALAYANPNGQ